MDYSSFSSIDFIRDEYFQNWVLKPSEETDNFWNHWLLDHPEKREAVEEARNILSHIIFKEHLPTEGQVKHSLASTLSIIQNLDEQPEENSAVVRAIRFRQLLKIAAVFIAVILTSGIIYYTYWNAKTTISTKYSEIKKVALPDGSQVVLNAHSTITYFTHTKKSRPRQVWLDGEAFFNVTHINKNEQAIQAFERFIVSTNNLDVNVLGTSFNVKKRSGTTEVVLATGKIRVDFNEKYEPSITMHPGQIVSYNNTGQQPMITTVDPSMYTTWMQKKLMVKGVSVNAIAQDIQDYFGYKVQLEDPAIGSRKMEGTLLMDDIHDVLFVLSSTLNVKIEIRGDTLVFKKGK